MEERLFQNRINHWPRSHHLLPLFMFGMLNQIYSPYVSNPMLIVLKLHISNKANFKFLTSHIRYVSRSLLNSSFPLFLSPLFTLYSLSFYLHYTFLFSFPTSINFGSLLFRFLIYALTSFLFSLSSLFLLLIFAFLFQIFSFSLSTLSFS